MNTAPLVEVAQRTRRTGRLGYGALTVGSLLVVGYAAVLVGSGFRLLSVEVADNHVPPLVWGHIVFSSVALLVMPCQLSKRVRRLHPRAHRIGGRVYAGSAVVGGTLGALAAITTANGVIAGAGFLTLGVLWVGTTVAAVRASRSRRVDEHRRWAIRSAALIFAAVTLRLELGVGMALGLEFAVAYSVVAWLCWVPNLAFAEWLQRRERREHGAVISTA